MIKYCFFALTLLLLSCQSNQKKEKDTLTVTIEPQRFFLEEIVGDKFSVKTLVPPGSSPETYEPAPSAMVNLGNSKLYFKVGFLGYENAWSDKLKANNPDVKIIDCSEGIELIYGEHHHDHDNGHSHEHEGEAVDPHVWSSPKNALKFSQNMLDAVIEMDKENADFYRVNFEKLSEKIRQTDATIASMLDTVSNRSFIIYHPALSYFANDYGLHQHSIEFEGKNPSPAQMRNLIDLSEKENIQVVFIQQEFDKKNAEVIAKEIGAESFTINPLAYEWDKELMRIAKILSGQINE